MSEYHSDINISQEDMENDRMKTDKSRRYPGLVRGEVSDQRYVRSMTMGETHLAIDSICRVQSNQKRHSTGNAG
jgi:hypothetical protein